MTTKKEAFAVPTIYLSPSTQEYNPYVTGGDEEYYMNLLADELEPWLRSSGIRWTRNDPGMTAADAIRQSNQGNYDLHLALHSNASPPGQAGQNRGSVVYYDPRSSRGRRAAQIIARNLRDIYPGRVQTLTTTERGEANKTTAPAVLVEVAYHDNPEDAMWITANLPAIAENLALSVTEYLGVPLVEPHPETTGRVAVSSGGLNLRSRPSTSAGVLMVMPNRAPVTILGQWNDWYVVEYRGNIGYAAARYIASR